MQKNTLNKNKKRIKSRIHRHKGDFRWTGVKAERYKKVKSKGGWASITRNVLAGMMGENLKFHFRYFEIQPGGYSSLEYHKHEHVVVCIRGKGDIILGKKVHSLNYLDTVYIAPNIVHQLRNPYDEPFGFFCVVNAKRDVPKPLDTQYRYSCELSKN